MTYDYVDDFKIKNGMFMEREVLLGCFGKRGGGWREKDGRLGRS